MTDKRVYEHFNKEAENFDNIIIKLVPGYLDMVSAAADLSAVFSRY